ncbi:MAG: HAMP domain-containing protein [Clostridia bacterium]|nr:HAMP domain-containing protein [Clostridia bacterium]
MTNHPRTAPLHSIALRLFAVIAGCVLLLLVAVYLLNTLVLKEYYIREKQDTVSATFSSINSVCEDSARLQERLINLQDNGTVDVVLWTGRQLLYSSQNSDRVLLPAYVTEPPGSYTITVTEEENMLSGHTGQGQAIRLVGTLNNGWNIHLRTPVAAIEESVAVTNRFLLISGGAALVLSLLVSLLLARRFTQPIRRLASEADRVARLDFSGRQPIRGKDELAHLEHSIRTMSVALENTITQLQEDIAQKEQQDRTRRAFIANVSHELKTPLALIGTYAEGLREDIADGGENRQYYCEVIEDEARKVNQLLRRMTTLMQLESGREQLEPEAFDITELLMGLVEKHSPAIAEKQVHLQLDTVPAQVMADVYLMENVLQNYLSNALNHVTEGGVIRLSVAPMEEKVRVTVYNTGPHIPHEDLPRIWDSFYKVDKARTRAYGGSGIGLSVVAAILKAHGFPYGVENREGGVAFYAELTTAPEEPTA